MKDSFIFSPGSEPFGNKDSIAQLFGTDCNFPKNLSGIFQLPSEFDYVIWCITEGDAKNEWYNCISADGTEIREHKCSGNEPCLPNTPRITFAKKPDGYHFIGVFDYDRIIDSKTLLYRRDKDQISVAEARNIK